MTGYLLPFFYGRACRCWGQTWFRILALCVVCWLVGCKSTSTVYQNYILATAPSDKRTPLKTTMGVFPVEVAGWLDRKNITWSDGDVQLQSSIYSQWGEPLPLLLTQVMAQNLRRLAGLQTWVSTGPWTRDKRPAVVVLLQVQSLAVVGQQLQLSVAWTLEDKSGQQFAQRNKVYTLHKEDDSAHSLVVLLSQAWGQVAADLMQAVTTDLAT